MKRLLYIAIIAVTFSACSGDRKINKAAAGYGQADAQTLIETAGSMTPLELEGYILGVKATEYDYRESGHEKAADLYIEGFEKHIRENSDSLANIIF